MLKRLCIRSFKLFTIVKSLKDRMPKPFNLCVVHPILQALHDRALVLERLARRQMQLPHHHPHVHDSAAPPPSERAISSTRYDSIKSPTFTSLKFSMPIPHSNPSRTSRTSSLNRLSDASVPS